MSLLHASRYRCFQVSLLAVVFWAGLGQALENAVVEQRIMADVNYLASDELQGRGIDTPGIAKAAEYIRAQFRAAGLRSATADGSYFQYFTVHVDSKVNLAQTHLVLRGPEGRELKLEVGKDFQPLAHGGNGKIAGPILFAGYGITAPEYKYDDYQDAKVEGKVVLVLRREPQQDNPKSVFDGKATTKYSVIVAKVQNAWGKKAAAMLMVNEPFSAPKQQDDTLVPANYVGFEHPAGMPVAQIKQEVAEQLLAASPLRNLKEAESAIDKELRPTTQLLPGWSVDGQFSFERVDARLANVVGVIEGEGPHAKETIVIGAHYDHLGYGGPGSLAGVSNQIHNGADDNASGTAAVIELARRFGARNSRPARRLVFIAFCAEERGLLGSRHYVKKDPLFPLKETVAMLNFDMVGRMSDDKLILFGTETAKELDPLVTKLNETHHFKLHKPSGGASTGPSDQAEFYRAGIPVCHFFTGVHSDYHRPSDDADKINVVGIRRIVAYSEDLVDALLQPPKGPEFVKVKEEHPRGDLEMTGGKMAYLGTLPDYGAEVEGVVLSDVREGSPAAKGGLKAGDVIIAIAGAPIKSARGLANALYKHKPGETVEIVVIRGKEKMTLKATLGSREQ